MFPEYDPPERFRVQRFQVYFVRECLVGHDGGGVGVDQHHVDARLLQHAARLCTRVVKFRRLTDDDGTGADYHYFFQIGI